MTTTSAATPATPEPARRPSRGLVAAVCAFVLAVGVAGYAWRGNFEALKVGPGEGVEAAGGVTIEQVEAMVANLAKRMESRPDDAEGWRMLGRSYNVLGRPQQAVPAFRRVVELQPGDAQALADLADAMGAANGNSLLGEPETVVARALAIDPKNEKALALAGTIAFDRSDFARAAQLWQQAIDNADPQAEFTQQLRQALAEATQRAGAAVAPAAAAADSRVTGRVSLAPALQRSVAPDDTVWVFARAVEGPKMPLAILKRRAADLPFDFQLDDTQAMNPAAKLAAGMQVVVGARVSKSGKPVAEAGDLQGLSTPVAVGAKGLRIEIGEVVR